MSSEKHETPSEAGVEGRAGDTLGIGPATGMRGGYRPRPEPLAVISRIAKSTIALKLRMCGRLYAEDTLLQRLTQDLQHTAAALRPCIQEAHAVMRDQPPASTPLPSIRYLLPGGIVTTVSCAGPLTHRCELSWFPVSHAVTALTHCQPLTIHRRHHGRPRRVIPLQQPRSVSRRREWRGAARDPARPDGALRESPARYPPRRPR
jgi:hypothetical protein